MTFFDITSSRASLPSLLSSSFFPLLLSPCNDAARLIPSTLLRSWRTVCKRWNEFIPHTILRFSNRDIFFLTPDRLRAFPNLTNLSCERWVKELKPFLCDETLVARCLESAGRLRVLHYRCGDLDWTKLPNLEELTIWKTAFVSSLTALSSLHTLRIQTDEEVPESVTLLTTLTSLSCFHDLPAVDFSHLTLLRALDVRRISPSFLIPTTLQTLKLRGCLALESRIVANHHFPFLTTAQLRSCSLSFLEACPSLTSLSVSHFKKFIPVSLLSNLTSLSIDQFVKEPSGESMLPITISELTNLSHLSVNVFPLDLTMLRPLTLLTSLTFSLSESQVEHLPSLSRLTALRTQNPSFRRPAFEKGEEKDLIDFSFATSLRVLQLVEAHFNFDSLNLLTNLTELICPNADFKGRHISNLTNLRHLRAKGPTLQRKTAKTLKFLETVNYQVVAEGSRTLLHLPLLVPFHCVACKRGYVVYQTCINCRYPLETCQACVGREYRDICADCHRNQCFLPYE